jgi:hypothetical protein
MFQLPILFPARIGIPPEFSYKNPAKHLPFPFHHPTHKTSSFATNEGPRRRSVEKA